MSNENKKKKKKVVASKKTIRNAPNNKKECKKCKDYKATNKALKIDLSNAKRQQRTLERSVAKLQKLVDRLNKKAKAEKDKKSKSSKKTVAKKSAKKTNAKKASKAKVTPKKTSTRKIKVKKAVAKKPKAQKASPKKTSTKPAAKKVVSSSPPARPQPKKTAAKTTPAKPTASRTRGRRPAPPSDLKIIEGIGPAIEKHLNTAGIKTFAQLGRTSIKKLKETLVEKGGNRYAMYDPSTWPQQGKLAAANKMDELKKLQDELIGGKK